MLTTDLLTYFEIWAKKAVIHLLTYWPTELTDLQYPPDKMGSHFHFWKHPISLKNPILAKSHFTANDSTHFSEKYSFPQNVREIKRKSSKFKTKNTFF